MGPQFRNPPEYRLILNRLTLYIAFCVSLHQREGVFLPFMNVNEREVEGIVLQHTLQGRVKRRAYFLVMCGASYL